MQGARKVIMHGSFQAERLLNRTGKKMYIYNYIYIYMYIYIYIDIYGQYDLLTMLTCLQLASMREKSNLAMSRCSGSNGPIYIQLRLCSQWTSLCVRFKPLQTHVQSPFKVALTGAGLWSTSDCFFLCLCVGLFF